MLPTSVVAGLQQMVSTCLDLGIHFRGITFTGQSSSTCDWFPRQQLHLVSLTLVVQTCVQQMQSCEIYREEFSQREKGFSLRKRSHVIDADILNITFLSEYIQCELNY